MFKPLQLTTAAACGLHVQPTLVTNVPSAASRFASDHGRATRYANPSARTQSPKVASSRSFTLAGSPTATSTSWAGSPLQPPSCNIGWIKPRKPRVVVIGERMFTVTIVTDSPRARVDWRADFTALRYRLVDTPPEVEKGLRRYMDSLGLAYAAVDFAIDRDGRWCFLESNSSGQYGWLEAQTGAPITAALADLLTHQPGNIRDHSRQHR